MKLKCSIKIIYQNIKRLDNIVKTLDNIVKNSKKNISNFVIENADGNFYYNMHLSVNYALLFLMH